MGFITRGFIWAIPIQIFAYVLFGGPIYASVLCSLEGLLTAKALLAKVAAQHFRVLGSGLRVFRV